VYNCITQDELQQTIIQLETFKNIISTYVETSNDIKKLAEKIANSGQHIPYEYYKQILSIRKSAIEVQDEIYILQKKEHQLFMQAVADFKSENSIE
jgi:hypothetical protein